MEARLSPAQLRQQFQMREATPPSAAASGAALLTSKRTKSLTLVAIGAGALTIGGAFVAMRPSQSTGVANVAAVVEEQAQPFVPKGDPEGQVFTSVENCAVMRLVAPAECAALALQAERDHEALAVGHDSLEECEQEYGVGRCANPKHAAEPRRRSSFIPLVAGFAIGKMIAGKRQAAPLYSHPSDGPNRMRQSSAMPIYASQAKAAEQLRAAERARVEHTQRAAATAAAPRAGAAPRAAPAPQAAAAPASRGGFGASASAATSSSS